MGSGVSSSVKIFKKTKLPCRDDYYVGCIIGKGGFGVLREVKRIKTNKWFAMKEFNLKNDPILEILVKNELNIFKKLHYHPFIIKLYTAFHDHNSVSFILELLSGGDLRLAIRAGQKFDEIKTGYIIGCIGSALHHLHLHHIIHRDVKPENILFDNGGVPKLIDFGISSCLSSSSFVCQSRSGTKEYLAPEVLVPKTHYHGYESDFWSLGVVMYELLFRKRPYDNLSPLIVNYSRDTYQSAWELYANQLNISSSSSSSSLKNDNHKFISTTSILNTIETTITTSFKNNINSLIHSNNISSVAASSSLSSSFNELSINDLESFLASDLHTPSDINLILTIPESNSMNEVTSPECGNMLSSLLDVQIHKRLGAVKKFNDFLSHNFFKKYELDVKDLEFYPSPFSINLSLIGEHIWMRYYDMNQIDQLSNYQMNLLEPNNEISDQNQDNNFDNENSYYNNLNNNQFEDYDNNINERTTPAERSAVDPEIRIESDEKTSVIENGVIYDRVESESEEMPVRGISPSFSSFSYVSPFYYNDPIKKIPYIPKANTNNNTNNNNNPSKK